MPLSFLGVRKHGDGLLPEKSLQESHGRDETAVTAFPNHSCLLQAGLPGNLRKITKLLDGIRNKISLRQPEEAKSEIIGISNINDVTPYYSWLSLEWTACRTRLGS